MWPRHCAKRHLDLSRIPGGLMRVKATLRDPDLEHQIQLLLRSGYHGKIFVSCNCLPPGQYFGITTSDEEAWKLYDEGPHIGAFTPGDRGTQIEVFAR